MQLLFTKFYAFPYLDPAAWFVCPLNTFLLGPAVLWSLLTSQASHLLTVPQPLCNPHCWSQGGHLIPWTAPRGALRWSARLLTADLLESDACVMSSSGLLLSHVDKGWAFLAWMGPVFFFSPWTLCLCSPLVPVSRRPSCGQHRKRSHSRNVVIMAEKSSR